MSRVAKSHCYNGTLIDIGMFFIIINNPCCPRQCVNITGHDGNPNDGCALFLPIPFGLTRPNYTYVDIRISIFFVQNRNYIGYSI